MKYEIVRIWLWIGVGMVLVQIILGGITRLTGSGLSITKWDIVTGTIPPLNEEEWQKEFDLYKMTPQYHQINVGMDLQEFKFIYFWEYLHRIWARLIGFVFLIPFLVFFWRRWLDKAILQNLAVAVLLGLIVAVFGWIMVASGLIERPWVNAYKLTVHLNLGMLLYAWLLWVAIGKGQIFRNKPLYRLVVWTTVVLVLQLILGGLMSGMKAAVYYPTWPDMHGEFIPKALFSPELWTVHHIFDAYEQGPMPGMVQFLHRITGYLLGLLSIIIIWKSIKYDVKYGQIRAIAVYFGGVVLIQIVLGVLTVINSVGSIPLWLGVLHQAGAIFVLTGVVWMHRKVSR